MGRPAGREHARSISLALVLPTEPVTATMRAFDRARAATPSRSIARSVSSTAKDGPSAASRLARSRDTTAATAPASKARAT